MADLPPPGWWQQPPGPPQAPPPGAAPFAAGPPAYQGAPQPGYSQVGYGYSVGGLGPARRLGGVSTAVMVLLAVAGVGAGLLAAALVSRASLIADRSLTFDEAVASDDRVAGAVIVYSLGSLVAGILWLIWQFRHAKNAVALGGYEGLGPGWAIGGWFLPIGNFFLPQSQLYAASKVSDPTGARRAPGVVVAWWVAYVAGGLVAATGQFMRPASGAFIGTIEDFQQADRIQALGLVILVGAAALAIGTVRTCTVRQQTAFQARGVPA